MTEDVCVCAGDDGAELPAHGAGGAAARSAVPPQLPVSTGSCLPLFLRVRQLHPTPHVPDEEGKVTQQGQGLTS